MNDLSRRVGVPSWIVWLPVMAVIERNVLATLFILRFKLYEVVRHRVSVTFAEIEERSAARESGRIVYRRQSKRQSKVTPQLSGASSLSHYVMVQT